MKSFTEAYEYIKNTPAKDIATRMAIFGGYINMRMHCNLGHDIILDITAALYGPFDLNFVEDSAIMDMLDRINFGFDQEWARKLWEWAVENATSEKELHAFDDMLFILMKQGKCDEILEHYNYICKVIRPSHAEYFPEMELFASMRAIKPWPRI